MKNNLDKILIRAKVADKWDNYSIKELVDNGNAGQVAEWFMRKIMGAVPLQEGQIVTLEDADNMVSFLKAIGFTIYELKGDL